MSGNLSAHQSKNATSKPTFSLSQPGILQRTCACGGVPGLTGECEECSSKRLSGQRNINPLALSNEQPTEQIQRSPLGGYSLANLAIQPRERFGIQTKLAISQPGDKYEKEADRIADEVMRMPEPKIQLEEEEEEMGTCDCSNPREYPTQDFADYFQTRFPHLQVGTYCVTEYPHNRYNCYGLSVGEDRIVSEQEIVEHYGRRTYRGEDSITYDDLDNFFISHGYIPQGYWHNASIVAYGTRTTPKHVAVKTDRECNNTVLYDSKLGTDGPRITHYLDQLEGNFYGKIQRGYIRGRLPQTPTYPTRIPYRLPVRQM